MFYEVLEEFEHFRMGVGHGFWVPLDCPAVVVGGAPVDGFNDAVGGCGGDGASGAGCFGGLVMEGIYFGFIA